MKKEKIKAEATRGKLKRQISEVLKRDDWKDTIAELVRQEGNRVSTALYGAIYDKDEKVKHRAISAFGILAKVLSETEFQKVRYLARRNVWMLTEESGGIPWGAPEIMGEIIANERKLAEEFVSILMSYSIDSPLGGDNYLEHDPLRMSVYWGIFRVARKFPDLVLDRKHILLIDFRNENNPDLLAPLFYIAGEIKLTEAEEFIKKSEDSDYKLNFYIDDKYYETTLGEAAKEALRKIGA